jgi:RNA polymerase sigma-70 factor (sigma-E family)
MAADADADSDYTEFVRTRSTALLRTAYLLTGDRGLAEDLVQTALTKVYLSWGRIRDRAAIEAYARRTLVTTATSWWRRRSWRSERPSGDDLPDFAVPAGTDEVDERARVWACVQALPPRQRAVIVLRYYEDLTESQTAEFLGCAVGTVKTQAHRAMKRLRLSLGESAAESWCENTADRIVSEARHE